MNNEENKAENEIKADSTPSLHTLEGDLLASMKDENYSSNIVKIVTHDNDGKGKRPGTAQDTPPNPAIKRYVLAGIVLIVGVGVGIFYTKNLPGKNTDGVNVATTTPAGTSTTTTKVFTQAPTIFDADVVMPIKIASTNKIGFIDIFAASKRELLANKIANKTNITFTTDVSLEDLFNKLQFSGPQQLIRSFSADKSYNFGAYHVAGEEFETYLLVKVDTFDLAFSGMLDWEKSMPIDLQQFFTFVKKSTVNTATNSSTTTSTSTSTPVETSFDPITPSNIIGKYTDKVIKNIDTRTYTDEARGVRIVYGFINKNYLLITSGEASFADIVNKLLVKNVLR